MRLVLAALLLAGPASAKMKEPKMPPKDEPAPYHATVPEGWKLKKLNGPDLGSCYSRDAAEISVTRFGLKGSKHRSPESFLNRLRRRGKDPERAGTARVAGGKAPRYRRVYRISIHEEEGPREFSEWFYEEYVILRQEGSFWVLSFKETSPGYPDRPKSLADWERFLSGFRLE